MRRRLALVLLLLLTGLAVWNAWRALTAPRWYRGNLHTHSLLSDGTASPQEMVERYRAAGYDFLAFTEHDKLTRRDDGSDPSLMDFDQLQEAFPDLLLIDGEEVSGKTTGGAPVHLNAFGIRESVPPPRGATPVEIIRKTLADVEERRRRRVDPLVQVNHPNFHWALTAQDLIAVPEVRLFEVYNPLGLSGGNSDHPSTERIWDEVLAWRYGRPEGEPLFGTAVDDAHRSDLYVRSGVGNGWVCVQADGLTEKAVLEALREGRFYASTGVALRSVDATAQGLYLEIEPVQGVGHATEFLGARVGGPPGEVLARVEGESASYEFRGDELYVRALVRSSLAQPAEHTRWQSAWVQPVRGPACQWP